MKNASIQRFEPGKKKIAGLIRLISVPPVVVIALICSLWIHSGAVFQRGTQAIWMSVFLGLIPALAYPLQALVPVWRRQGRKSQRNLAFVFSVIGYGLALCWSLVTETSPELRALTVSYCISAVILILFNKLLKIKSSGHSCSATSPVLFTFLYAGWEHALIWLVMDAAVIWSSLYLKRHTRLQLLLGVVTCILSLCISILIISR